MNQVCISGNVVRDPEVRYLDTGKAVTNFTIALNERGKDGKEYTSYIRCAAWADLGVRIADQARTGTRLVVWGKLSQKTWTDQNGKKRDDVSVLVQAADIVVKSPPATRTQEQDAEATNDFADLPF